MGEVNRKARKKLIKETDMLEPININIIGSKDDPCFGKHNDPKAEECMRCGDSEICAMVMAQKLHLLRDKVESKQAFKDMEERDIKPLDEKELKKKVKSRIREVIRLSDGVTKEKVIADVTAIYGPFGFYPGRVEKILNRMIETTDKFIYKRKTNKLIWKDNS